MIEPADETVSSDSTRSKVKDAEIDGADVTTLDIKSRLSLQTLEQAGEPSTNGLHQVNGICESPTKTTEGTCLTSEGQDEKASHLHKNENSETTSATRDDIEYISYTSELQMPDIMKLIQKDLSEPYSIYTYRYFIHNWPKLCFLAMHGEECVGAIVCKLDIHRKVIKRGYIAMLAVDVRYRKRKIGSNLVRRAIQAMVEDDADEVVLETEITNRPALRLYENLGFVRDKRLFRYYLNGVDALRLKLWLR